MAGQKPSTLTGVFHRPFDEQLAFFRRKLRNLVPTTAWDDLLRAEHDHAFMVAGAAKADLLQDLADAVDKAIAEGVGFDQFYKDFESIVAKHGWTGWTGEETPARRRWRARVIYQTNVQVSYSAGRLAQLREGKFAFWVYHHSVGELHPRPLHVSWDGLVLPANHPFWHTRYPPSDWGCRCYVTGARTEKGARRQGGDLDKKLPDDWDKIDPLTGEPPGVGKGWGYMPGDTVHQVVREMAGKIQHWDYSIAKSYMQSVPEDARDALATAYRS
ncbi:MAG TPA: phage minor head protein, partial [Oleiagrimonas sp.]|nr:phage minor head protein [Oleiagrimonas sp.]